MRWEETHYGRTGAVDTAFMGNSGFFRVDSRVNQPLCGW